MTLPQIERTHLHFTQSKLSSVLIICPQICPHGYRKPGTRSGYDARTVPQIFPLEFGDPGTRISSDARSDHRSESLIVRVAYGSPFSPNQGHTSRVYVTWVKVQRWQGNNLTETNHFLGRVQILFSPVNLYLDLEVSLKFKGRSILFRCY